MLLGTIVMGSFEGLCLPDCQLVSGGLNKVGTFNKRKANCENFAKSH